jgi:hypothetical protein
MRQFLSVGLNSSLGANLANFGLSVSALSQLAIAYFFFRRRNNMTGMRKSAMFTGTSTA